MHQERVRKVSRRHEEGVRVAKRASSRYEEAGKEGLRRVSTRWQEGPKKQPSGRDEAVQRL